MTQRHRQHQQPGNWDAKYTAFVLVLVLWIAYLSWRGSNCSGAGDHQTASVVSQHELLPPPPPPQALKLDSSVIRRGQQRRHTTWAETIQVDRQQLMETRKLLWLTGIQVKAGGEVSAYIEKSGFYQEAYLTALLSARAHAPSLKPVLILEGDWSGQEVFLARAKALGVTVAAHKLSFEAELRSHQREGVRSKLDSLWGSFLKVDLPLIMDEITPLLASERNELDMEYRYLGGSGLISILPQAYNWRAYWGKPPVNHLSEPLSPIIIHFHGPKPAYAACVLHQLRSDDHTSSEVAQDKCAGNSGLFRLVKEGYKQDAEYWQEMVDLFHHYVAQIESIHTTPE